MPAGSLIPGDGIGNGIGLRARGFRGEREERDQERDALREARAGSFSVFPVLAAFIVTPAWEPETAQDILHLPMATADFLQAL